MIGDELAKDLDALIAEAKAQPPVTAPTPERRVGEERLVPLAEMDFGVFYQVLDDARKADATLIRDLALDLLDERAANALLTAEVERLTGIELKYRKSLWMGHGHDHLYGDDGEMQCTQCPGEAWDYRRAPLEVIERAAWFARTTSLPTPAPEATE